MRQAKKIPEEIYANKDVNAYLLSEKLMMEESEELFEAYAQRSSHNEYLRMLEFVNKRRQLEEDDKSKVSPSLAKQSLDDFKKEQEDVVEIKKAGYKEPSLDFGDSQDHDASSDRVAVKLMRPPRTSKEAIRTLQQADKRYKENR